MANRHRWKVLALACMLAPCRFCCGEEPSQLQWLRDYNEARIAGMEQSRPLLLYVTTDRCHYCDKMEQQTFSHQEVLQGLEKDFVVAKVHLDPDSDLSQKLMITIYPTTIIISPQGRVLEYVRGFMGPADLQRKMCDAMVQQHVLAANQ